MFNSWSRSALFVLAGALATPSVAALAAPPPPAPSAQAEVVDDTIPAAQASPGASTSEGLGSPPLVQGQSNNRGYVVGAGGVARRANRSSSNGADPASPPVIDSRKAPIGVNEPGVNRRAPQ
ncbi:MAG: hypothetical protein ACK4IS_09330 [Erythrobacter sp.]